MFREHTYVFYRIFAIHTAAIYHLWVLDMQSEFLTKRQFPMDLCARRRLMADKLV